jgi:hypothetical protein
MVRTRFGADGERIGGGGVRGIGERTLEVGDVRDTGGGGDRAGYTGVAGLASRRPDGVGVPDRDMVAY